MCVNDRPSPETAPAAEAGRLVRGARSGAGGAFGRLVESPQRAVPRLAYRLLGDPDDADGAAQDTFIKAWATLGEFRHECPFGAWLARVAVNQCRDRLKRKKVVVAEVRLRTRMDGRAVSPLEMAVDSSPGPEARAIGREIGRKIAELIRVLPGMQREVFALRYYDDRSLAEIAALCRVSVGTVKPHLFRATQRIGRSMEALYGHRLPIPWPSNGWGACRATPSPGGGPARGRVCPLLAARRDDRACDRSPPGRVGLEGVRRALLSPAGSPDPRPDRRRGREASARVGAARVGGRCCGRRRRGGARAAWPSPGGSAGRPGRRGEHRRRRERLCERAGCRRRPATSGNR